MVPALRRSALFLIGSAAFLVFPSGVSAANVTISIVDNQFSPKTVSVNPGDTITFVNQGAMPHTATADNGLFDSGTIQPGQSFGATFNQGGTYQYHCKFHGSAGGSGMAGTIIVGQAAANPSPVYAQSGGSIPVYPPAYSAGGTVAASGSGTAATGLQAQAQALLAQIAALQAQIQAAGGTVTATSVSSAGPSTYSASCPLVGRSLKLGLRGDDVTRLQEFLARDSEVYPEAQVTGYFGALTQSAVQKWQAKYNIVSSGTPDSTGYGVVGPRTAAAISIICSGGSINGISASASSAAPTVGGFITVTPVSGSAPLTVSVIATVNTANSCAGAIYNLDFGDTTNPVSIPVEAGNCDQIKQTYPHTYQYGGNYTIKLSAQGHSTTANISVTGPAAPAPPVFTPGLPRESFSAYPTTGSAPLTVTFSGIVNSNNYGFCLGGCVDTMDYGDGTLDNVQLPASVGGWLNYRLTHTYTQPGGYRATLYQGGATPGQPTVGAVTIIVGGGSNPDTGGGYVYNPPTITSSGSNSLAFTAQFDLPSSCTGYNLSWGDGTAEVTQADASSSCASNPVMRSFSHTYAGGGAYTIVLKRGPQLSRVDDIAVTISN